MAIYILGLTWYDEVLIGTAPRIADVRRTPWNRPGLRVLGVLDGDEADAARLRAASVAPEDPASPWVKLEGPGDWFPVLSSAIRPWDGRTDAQQLGVKGVRPDRVVPASRGLAGRVRKEFGSPPTDGTDPNEGQSNPATRLGNIAD